MRASRRGGGVMLALLAACAVPPSPEPKVAQPEAAPTQSAPARLPEPLPAVVLWPAGAPLQRGDDDVDRPRLVPYLAPGPGPHAAILVCPGGGYGTLALGHEGRDIGRWCQQHGISAFVLQYRIAPKYRHPCPLLDAQRALRTVRARAGEWQVDATRLGVMGFSAGGHLASTLATHFDTGAATAADAIERASCRPDFAVLVYPVLALDQPWTHQGSKRNLLGPAFDDAAIVHDLSTAHAVTAATPPTFLLHTLQDRVVPAQNSIEWWEALRTAGVPCELHVFERGEHGFGLALGDPVLRAWSELLLAWLRDRGVLRGDA